MKISAPICAVCGRQVDHFEHTRDASTHANEFVARCHGEEQRVTLSAKAIEMAGPDGISMLRAFDSARLAKETVRRIEGL